MKEVSIVLQSENEANASDDDSKSKELSATEGIQEVKWKEVSIVSQSENEANASDDQSKVKK